MATQAEVARHLGISQPAVTKLVQAGVFTQSGRGALDLDRCRVAYLSRLREEAAGRAAAADPDGEDFDLVAERARLAAAQADRIEMQNEETRGALVRVEHVTSVFGKHVSTMRTRLLALPSECAPLVAPLRDPAQINAILTDRLYDAMQSICDAMEAASEAPGDTDFDEGDTPENAKPPAPSKRRTAKRGKDNGNG